jgi:endo-1,4-beta-xylanase
MRSKVLFSGLATCLALAGCGSGGTDSGTTAGSGGATGSGGGPASGGTTGSGGKTGSGGTTSSGGVTGSGGTTGSGGVTSTGGTTGSGGTIGTGGVTGAAGRGGVTGSGGAAGRGGVTGSGGAAGRGGATGAGGATGTGGSVTDGGVTVDCSATLPTGGTTYTGTNINGSADGLGYGIWTNGSGGSITVFPNAHAFSTSWNNSQDFLAHLGLDFNASKAYTSYGTIQAQFSEVKSGSAGGFSSIGMYGWMHSPCVEWYVNEDSFNGLAPRGGATAVIDGATYYLTTTTTNGTGGANACEAGHSGGWTQMISTRQSARTCGNITVSDHFAAWAKQGWSLGSLASVHINVEVGGGSGSIQFPVANVTTTSK